MEQRNLGKSGLSVSAVGLGCNNFGGRIDLAATRKVVHKALDLGITFFDEADTYGDPRGSSEACLGEILGDRRKDIALATKFARPMDAAGRFQGASRHTSSPRSRPASGASRPTGSTSTSSTSPIR